MASISLHALHKRYGATPALRGLDLRIDDGEFVALVGPSGCGKSTLLRMIAGLELVSGGEIRLGERVLNDVAPRDRDIAMVFQNYALYPHKTVAENLGFALRMQRRSPADIERRVREVADTLGLEPLLGRYPRELSGGQRQRVAMGRAIVRQPQAFLFDEPLSNLDAQLRVQMRTEIRALHQRLGTTTVYVTHDQIEAMTMADRIVVLRDGRIEQVGTPLELYDRPANAFVAAFIGSPSMNLLPGRVRVAAGQARFVTDDGVELPLPADHDGLHDGQPLVYGARPEHFALDGEAGLPFEVDVVEPTGSETQIAGRWGGRRITAAFRQRMASSPGDRLRLAPQLEHVHLFEAGSGRRIGRQQAGAGRR